MNKNIVVLISGNGSNLQAILDAVERNQIAGEVVAVISNNENAYGLQRAKDANVDAIVLDHRMFSDRAQYDQALQSKIDSYHPDLVVLAGFMRILTDDFVAHYQGRMLNIHPSLLPKYKGLHTHQRALDAGDNEHGVSVHFVTAELDGGPVIIQSKVPIYEGDDAETLASRVQEQERSLYPLVVNWFCQERLIMQNNQAFLDNTLLPESGYAAD